MGRTGVRRRRIAAVLVAALVLVPVGARAAVHRERPMRAYTVRPGDTIWAIAARSAGAGGDPRALVDSIERANLGADPGRLEPGQVLYVPAR